ncbi:type I secretion system permease/ATPase [Pseudoalteromonas luteoviolacea]|uniref:type I secretion system permease/ATPase n=1 Tax=Pseudoalteromonas luteoviolacea TaxID=43657 RepID=UPI001150E749|nr:type I secretion system permease/ATPase [Pseudoalteromonas luteoviolacea]TQF70086.1 type I secretion system permease/ATPase [Pseudoalteromonas luteoviolacea]
MEVKHCSLQVMYGLQALAFAAKSFDKNVEVNYLKHQTGVHDEEIDHLTLCRCAKWIGLKASVQTTGIERLHLMPLPALVQIDGQFCVLLKIDKDEVQLYSPRKAQIIGMPLLDFSKVWNGELLMLAESEIKQSDVKFGFSWFIPSLKKHASQARKIILISFFIQLIALATPILFENVIDRVLVSRSVSSLQVLGIALLALAIFEPLYTYMRTWLFANLASKVSAELNARLFSHLVSLPMRYFGQRQTGQITARVREMEMIRQFLSGSALTMLIDLAFVIIVIAVLFAYAPLLTWIVLGSLVLYILFWLAIGPSLRRRVQAEFETSADNTAFLTEAVTGIETIKTSSVERGFEKQWKKSLASQLIASFRARVISIWAEQGISTIQKLSAALALWWGVKLVMSGDLTAGQLVAFNMLAGQVTMPILRLAQIWQDFQHCLISLRRVGDILDEEQEAGAKGLASSPDMKGSVQFHRVRFRYDDESPEVISNLSLDIKAGECIGITGQSGSGKSTLTKLLQRLYSPTSGEVIVDGMDLAIADPIELRRNLSVVLQESRLFAGSIAANISQCLPQATPEQIIDAAKLAGAHEFICSLPQGYQTQVGESGGRLSGGQRQRIAIARALITKPKILVLDEATSALDYESEATIIARLPEIAKGRTVISIAHRLNTIRFCDRIIVVEKGKIIEAGSHNELTSTQSRYKALWDLQTSS